MLLRVVVAGLLFCLAAHGLHVAQPVATAAAPHFLSDAYNQMQLSGDEAGSALQGVLSVEGSLNELKVDLSTEYGRWKKKQSVLIGAQSDYQHELHRDEVDLHEQGHLRAEAVRLTGDLALVQRENLEAQKAHEAARRKWQGAQDALQLEVQALLADIEAEQRDWNVTLTNIHNASEMQRLKQMQYTADILAGNTTLVELQDARSKHGIVSSRAQRGLLQQQEAYQQESDAVKAMFRDQQRLQLEHTRLAQQARKVAERRAETNQHKENCDEKIHKLEAGLATLAQERKDDTVKLRACQAMSADNAALQEKVNQCQAAKRAAR
jgi:hypothetical protein